MYGRADIYNSPQNPLGSGIFAEEVALGFEGEDDDEFGILGIALTKKARQKKWNKKLDKTLGKLKTLYEAGDLEKARKRAEKLSKIVTKLEKVEDGFEASPETVAWMDYAETGDSSALEQALGATAWTGEAVPAAPPPTRVSYREPSGTVPTSGSGVRGGGRPGRRRRRPPGFRPRRYAQWTRQQKLKWLLNHPNAASAPDPQRRDPRGWRRALAAMRGQYMPQAPGVAPARQTMARPMGPRGPMARAAFRAGRQQARQQRRGMAPPARRAARGAGGGRLGSRFRQAGAGARREARQAARQALRGRGFGAIEEAVEETAEEMGALPGTIGIEAFPEFPSSGIRRGHLLGDADLSDIVAFDDFEIEFEDDEDDSGTTAEVIREEGPQFGAVFKRRLDKRVAAAKRKYERLRDRAVSGEDWAKVEKAMTEYRQLAQAYKKAEAAPRAMGPSQVLAAMEQQPMFRSTAERRFTGAGGTLAEGVEAAPVSGSPEEQLLSEEALWAGTRASSKYEDPDYWIAQADDDDDLDDWEDDADVA